MVIKSCLLCKVAISQSQLKIKSSAETSQNSGSSDKKQQRFRKRGFCPHWTELAAILMEDGQSLFHQLKWFKNSLESFINNNCCKNNVATL